MYADAMTAIIKYTEEHGGGTFRRYDGSLITDGYAVARPDMIGGREIKRGNAEHAIRALVSALDKTTAKPEIIGTWVHGGHYYAEATTVLEDREQAIALGTRLGQESIYDLTAGEEIPLKVAPIMRARVIVSSHHGYGYGQTVAEAKLNHDRFNGLARPITIMELPDNAKWVKSESGNIQCPMAERTREETANADDILALTLQRVELEARDDVDYLIREGEVSNDEELREQTKDVSRYVHAALNRLTITNLLTLAQQYADELTHGVIYSGDYGLSVKTCLVQALTDAMIEDYGVHMSYGDGVQSAVSALLEECQLTDIEVGTDRVASIVKDMEEWDNEND